MSDKIKLLPEIVANQIAAGEVVQEPASVVKEMMENAVDAGATRIEVAYKNGGLDCITIVDNGCGMSPVDARMAFDRHATSKIATVEDIYALRTFGFRGEALASIAAVSEVTLRTRRQEDEVGTETTFMGGEYISQVPVMTPAGANFKVVNLLYNVPARRKFLPEQISRLAAGIKAEFNRIALCNPELELHLSVMDKDDSKYDSKYSSKDSGKNNPVILRPSTLAGRIVDVIGGNTIKSNLLEVEADTSIAKIHGYIGRPAAAKKRNGEQYMFVNGRFFRSANLNKAIIKAYEKLIPSDCTPSFFIYIEVDPERVDVNVSPKKTEVKFADTDFIWQILNAAVRETLAKTGAVPLMDFDQESGVEIPLSKQGAVYAEPRSASNEMYNPFLIEDDDDAPHEAGRVSDMQGAGYAGGRAGAEAGTRMPHTASAGIKPDTSFSLGAGAEWHGAGAEWHGAGADWHGAGAASEDFDDFESAMGREEEAEDDGNGTELDFAAEGKPSFSQVTYIGNGYAAAMYGRRFVAADLRRAAERVLYEQYMLLMGNDSSTSQRLLFPEKIILSNEEYALLEENAERFAALGFELVPEGNGTVNICGVPADTDNEAVDQLILELLHTFDMPVESERLRNEKVAAAMARSNAGKSVRGISNTEAAMLLERLALTDNTAFSPSGKAIMTEITADDIKHKLG